MEGGQEKQARQQHESQEHGEDEMGPSFPALERYDEKNGRQQQDDREFPAVRGRVPAGGDRAERRLNPKNDQGPPKCPRLGRAASNPGGVCGITEFLQGLLRGHSLRPSLIRFRQPALIKGLLQTLLGENPEGVPFSSNLVNSHKEENGRLVPPSSVKSAGETLQASGGVDRPRRPRIMHAGRTGASGNPQRSAAAPTRRS